jgi:hypothetical protein
MAHRTRPAYLVRQPAGSGRGEGAAPPPRSPRDGSAGRSATRPCRCEASDTGKPRPSLAERRGAYVGAPADVMATCKLADCSGLPAGRQITSPALARRPAVVTANKPACRHPALRLERGTRLCTREASNPPQSGGLCTAGACSGPWTDSRPMVRGTTNLSFEPVRPRPARRSGRSSLSRLGEPPQEGRRAPSRGIRARARLGWRGR